MIPVDNLRVLSQWLLGVEVQVKSLDLWRERCQGQTYASLTAGCFVVELDQDLTGARLLEVWLHELGHLVHGHVTRAVQSRPVYSRPTADLIASLPEDMRTAALATWQTEEAEAEDTGAQLLERLRAAIGDPVEALGL